MSVVLDPTSLPVSVALYASSQCDHCSEFKPAFRSAARASSNVPFFECDVATDPAAETQARRFGVGALPTTIFLRHGTPVWRIEGVVDQAVVVDRVRTVFADVVGGVG